MFESQKYYVCGLNKLREEEAVKRTKFESAFRAIELSNASNVGRRTSTM